MTDHLTDLCWMTGSQGDLAALSLQKAHRQAQLKAFGAKRSLRSPSGVRVSAFSLSRELFKPVALCQALDQMETIKICKKKKKKKKECA